MHARKRRKISGALGNSIWTKTGREGAGGGPTLTKSHLPANYFTDHSVLPKL